MGVEGADYLGDGAYIVRSPWDPSGVILRANHHEQQHCTDQVCLGANELENLIRYLTAQGLIKLGDYYEHEL